VQQDSIPLLTGLTGTTFDDPISWLTGVGANLFEDTRALAFRLLLLLIGGIIMYKAMSRFIAVDKVVNAGLQLGKSAALLGGG